ncbi:hypothetical protein [Azospirillum sp. ST 5-10]|uniref:hypothetical protein n=1 Tax=unclassified Azospirillum TaxID=2630922 RepID=UPI003F4A5A60
MRILIAIPHYAEGGSGYYGSTGADRSVRAAALADTVLALHRTLGGQQSLLLNRRHNVRARANGAAEAVLDVVVCTTGAHHALDGLALPAATWRHHPTAAEPTLLGFECHAALAADLDGYDWYGYLEDDLLVQDPLFLVKLAWFQSLAGPSALLLPNRYELLRDSPEKLYIDGHLDPGFAGRWQNVHEQPRLAGTVMGARVVLQRPNNPHAGCFILSAAQMRRWASSPWFLDRDVAFAGPLESAATLGMLKTFRVYKPAAESAGFLEIRHRNNRYLGNWLARPEVPAEPTWR